MARVRRAALGMMIVVGTLLALAQPAAAHSVSGVGATNWRSVLTGVSPQVPGLEVRLVEGGSRIELTNHGAEVVVAGYSGEPYLRVGPQGVFQNLRSPATYLNCNRNGCSVPVEADPQAPPEWKRLSSSRTVRWHDHRAHYMGNEPPPDVLRAPDKVHVEAQWTVKLQQGPTPITVTGNYTWVPSSNPFPWLVVTIVLAMAVIALGLTGAWGRPLAMAVVALTLNDIYHAVAIAWFWSGSFVYRLTKLFGGSFYSIVGWVLGLVAARLLWQRRVDGLYAAVFAGGSAALFTGLLDFTVLSRSQAPFAGSITVDRLTVAISLGVGVGVMVAALIAIRSTRPAYDDFDDGDFDLEESRSTAVHDVETAG